ncbi:MAG: class I SAM-dependent methyltransferase, partial [Proteobacteria bacterium]|nr:class I SAM-dependent methyltransferase [Pseudomonadota bacterium]
MVEIGSYLGRSTVVLGSVVKHICPRAKVYAIDPHEGELTSPDGTPELADPTFEQFMRNIRAAGLETVVEPIRSRSYEVKWDRPISLLLVDGLHDYENVSRDFHHFESHVVPGGYVAFHDYGDTYTGVKNFVDELVASGRYGTLFKVDILIVLRKLLTKSVSSGSQGLPPTHDQGSLAPPPGRQTREKRMTVSERTSLTDRLERHEKGAALLQQALKREMTRRGDQVEELDRIIIRQQNELHTKVGECNEVIDGLHARLKEEMEARGWTQQDLAGILSKPLPSV